MDMLDEFIHLLKDFNERLSRIGVTICNDGILISMDKGNDTAVYP